MVETGDKLASVISHMMRTTTLTLSEMDGGMEWFDDSARFTFVCTMLLDLLMNLRKMETTSKINAVQINNKQVINFENPMLPKVISVEEATSSATILFLSKKILEGYKANLDLKEFPQSDKS